MKRVAILGSTGSVGTSTLDVVEGLPGSFRVVALAARRNWRLLAEQARKYEAEVVALADATLLPQLQSALDGTSVRVLGGADGVASVAALDSVDTVVVAVVGAAGLPVSAAALCAGKHLALANKESLVMAGELLTGLAAEKGVEILPIDSEHSAIHQCLRTGRAEEVERLILTASGGPFRRFSRHALEHVTPEMALQHPTWNMGAKITIDSATLINKALEVLEAHWLFGVAADRIQVLVHPESVIHSMVEFRDRSVVAQLGVPDMRVPIQYALTCPDRVGRDDARLNLSEMKALTFEAPDTGRFPGLLLGWRAAREGGTSGAVLNAANEVAVELFLNRRIRFTDIVGTTVRVMDAHRVTHPSSMDDILEADRWAREKASTLAGAPLP